MPDVTATELPGVGIRYDYLTREGHRVGVLVHRTGRRELLMYADDDPDACVSTVNLDEGEARTLSELLGVSQVAKQLSELHQRVEGLDIDWVHVEPGAEWAGRSIGEAAVRTTTGVSIVAVLRDGAAIPSPEPDEVFQPGDTVVGIGTVDGLARAEAALQNRPDR